MASAGPTCERLIINLAALLSRAEAEHGAAKQGSTAATRWQRAAGLLRGELGTLQTLSSSLPTPNPSGTPSTPYRELQRTALRLTQLARTLDGLPAQTVQAEQQSVVFAAWHLLHALQQHASLEQPSTAGAAR